MIESGIDFMALSRIKQDKKFKIATTLKNKHNEIMQKWKDGYTFRLISLDYHNLSEKIIENYVIDFLAKEVIRKKKSNHKSVPKHQDGFTNFVDKILFTCLDNINKSKREKNDEKFESAV